MPQDAWQNFGDVYTRSGTTRGTTTSSGIFLVETGFTRRVVAGRAGDGSSGLRSSVAVSATFVDYQWQTVDTAFPTRARFRVRRFIPSQGATAIYAFSQATGLTGVVANWECRGY